MKFTAGTWRALIAFAVLAGAFALTLTQSAKLGLDLRGGTQIVLETQSTDRVKADRESTDRALSVLRGRVDALGVSEPTVARSGDRRIIIELAGVQDPRAAAKAIGQTAQLGFRQVLAPATEGQTPPEGQIVLPDEQGTPFLLGPILVDGDGVKDAAAVTETQGVNNWVVQVDFTGSGADGWKQLISAACSNPTGGQRVAIILDGKIISSPAAQPDLCASGGGNRTTIQGSFTQKEADDLSVLIKGGALPVPVKIIEQRTIGPSLGDAAIDASVEASIIGLALTALFIALIYRVVGFMATLALASYAVIAYALLVIIGSTLTLPGLAGFVLAIGLAIDANVLVFERAREEYRDRPEHGLAPALTTGFNKAWSAILDSNVTTLIAAGLLFFLASGAVKGFGVTLAIGVVASMISALVIARVIAEWAVRRSVLVKHPAASGIARTGRLREWLTTSGPNLMKRSGVWLGVSVAVVITAFSGLFVRGLDLGVEFTGGRIIEYSTGQNISVDAARQAVSDAGFPTAVVQKSSADGQGENITVRVNKITDDQTLAIQNALAAKADGAEKIRDDSLSATLGDELRTKALIAFVVAISAQILYLAWRFRWTYAIAAQSSMISVVAIVVGTFAWWGKPIDGVFLAAVLSIIGLAVNDTIVVFDRIREGQNANRGRPLRPIVNEAILQTIPRTVNTGIGAIFILSALAFLGGDSLKDFAIALIMGLSIGVLGTIFIASALAVLLEERFPFDPDRQPKKQVDPYSHVDSGQRDYGNGAVV